MSNPTTGFLCQTSLGVYQDLSGIFQPLNGGTQTSTTGFIALNGKDLNEIFLAATQGNYISFNTNFLVPSSLNDLSLNDLSVVFAPYNPVPFTISGAAGTTGTTYSYRMFNGYYEVYFLNSSNITFNTTVNDVQIVVVGGGGAGGQNPDIATASSSTSPPPNGGYSGGGGGGGYVNSSTNQTLYAGTTYNVTVGAGGSAGQAQTPVAGSTSTGSGNGGTSSFIPTDSPSGVSASGGNIGGNTMGTIIDQAGWPVGLTSAQGGAGQGAGGSGANIYGSINTNPTNGNSGASVILSSSYQFYVGGGGGGGGYYAAVNSAGAAYASTAAGGLGGGGGSPANAGAAYAYPTMSGFGENLVNSDFQPGYNYSGGGGAGMYGYASPCYGFSGGSGLVILCFAWPQ